MQIEKKQEHLYAKSSQPQPRQRDKSFGAMQNLSGELWGVGGGANITCVHTSFV